jgi:uncharacterized protein with HEPN domain
MNADDLSRLKHMVQYAQQALLFTDGKNRASLEEDTQLVLALCMAIGIVGKAATNISRDFQNENPQIPWPQIISMRNRLFHGYFEVNLDILWNTATLELPKLLSELRKIIPDETSKE